MYSTVCRNLQQTNILIFFYNFSFTTVYIHSMKMKIMINNNNKKEMSESVKNSKQTYFK